MDFTTNSSSYLRALSLSALCALLHNCQKVRFPLGLPRFFWKLVVRNFQTGLLPSVIPLASDLQAKVSLKKTGIVNKLDEINLLPGSSHVEHYVLSIS